MVIKVSTTKPAILGGSKLFPSLLRNSKPTLASIHEIEPDIRACLDSGILTKGRYLEEFEARVAEYAGVRNAVALSSCTTGLILAHSLLELSGEVIMPSFTFMATTLGAQWNGLKPKFVDIDPDTWNLDPEKLEEAITENTSAILAVHIFGNPVDSRRIEKIAEQAGVSLLFDSAHAFGSRASGIPAGGSGICEIFSTSPTKVLVTGEGGIVTTNDDLLAEKLRRAREYGNVGNYNQRLPGLNGRMPEINAILGISSLRRIEESVIARNKIARKLTESLVEIPGLKWQKVSPEDVSTYKDLSCQIDETEFGLTRDQLVQALEAEGIEMRTYYHIPCHLQEYWLKKTEGNPVKLPVTEKLSDTVISFPIWPDMQDSQIELLSQAVLQIHEWAPSIRSL